MFSKYNKVQQVVLDTTLRLIMEKDLQATSMSLISKEAGVSTGSIYYYFKSKEDIINELYKGIIAFYIETIYN
ncbi:MAG: TetR/AcrR family transcriptional regulator, partial [Gorillibacterium sp.]|nr:TetR/AcrR family transcriptional regulator [Gorillibacterium sp.]